MIGDTASQTIRSGHPLDLDQIALGDRRAVGGDRQRTIAAHSLTSSTARRSSTIAVRAVASPLRSSHGLLRACPRIHMTGGPVGHAPGEGQKDIVERGAAQATSFALIPCMASRPGPSTSTANPPVTGTVTWRPCTSSLDLASRQRRERLPGRGKVRGVSDDQHEAFAAYRASARPGVPRAMTLPRSITAIRSAELVGLLHVLRGQQHGRAVGDERVDHVPQLVRGSAGRGRSSARRGTAPRVGTRLAARSSRRRMPPE